MPGVVLAPFRPMKAGKISSMPLYNGMTTSATTDAQGIAVFDWLPKEASREYPLRGLTFIVKSAAGFSSPGMIRYERGAPMELVMRLGTSKSPRLGGTVRLPDGRPAGQVLLLLRTATASSMSEAARTDDDGKYAFDDLRPDVSYMLAVDDKSWAAATRRNVVLKEGQVQGEVNFTLTKGTLIHGRVTEEPDKRPAVGRTMALVEEGDPLPKDLRTLSDNKSTLTRVSPIDNQGHYAFRVTPGRYTLRWSTQDGVESVDVEVKNETEIVPRSGAQEPGSRDLLHRCGRREDRDRRDTNSAGVRVSLARSSALQDRRTRTLSNGTNKQPTRPFTLSTRITRSPALPPCPSGTDNVRLVLSPTATITGRVVDSHGQPWARQRVRVELAQGNFEFAPAHFAVSAVMTDDRGQYTYRDAPVGSSGEIAVYHQRDNPPLLTSRGTRSAIRGVV